MPLWLDLTLVHISLIDRTLVVFQFLWLKVIKCQESDFCHYVFSPWKSGQTSSWERSKLLVAFLRSIISCPFIPPLLFSLKQETNWRVPKSFATRNNWNIWMFCTLFLFARQKAFIGPLVPVPRSPEESQTERRYSSPEQDLDHVLSPLDLTHTSEELLQAEVTRLESR